MGSKIQFLTASEVAEMLQLNLETVYSLINRSGLPGQKIAGQWRFLASEIIDWYRQLSSQNSGERSLRPSPKYFPDDKLSTKAKNRPIKVILVDDCEIDRTRVARILNKSQTTHFELHQTATAQEALSAIQQQDFDIALIDHLLTDVDGLELLKRIRGQYSENELPAIILTGQGTEKIAIACFKNGAQDYLLKNQLDEESLLRTIINVVNTANLKSELEVTETKLREALQSTKKIDNDRRALLSDLSLVVRNAVNSLCNLSEIGISADETHSTKEFTNTVLEVSQNLISELSSIESRVGASSGISHSSPTTLFPEIEKPLPVSKGRILIVDDSEIERILLGKLLTSAGFSIDQTDNGKEAIELARSQDIDLLILDISMPAISGLDAAQAIRRNEQNCETRIPILAVTGMALVGDEAKCLAAGIDAYIAKPYSKAQLINSINILLGKRNMNAA